MSDKISTALRPQQSRSLLSPLLHRLTPVRRIRLILRHNRRYGLQLPLGSRVAAWRSGFTYMSYLIYELHQNNCAEYQPDYLDINYRREARYRQALSDKLSLALFLDGLGARGPEVLGYARRGQLIPLGHHHTETASSSRATCWSELIALKRGLVLKPVDGGGGRGVRLLRWPGGPDTREITIDGIPATESQALSLLESLDEYVVTGLVEQADYARELFPGTTNTLRLLTLWDYETGRPFLAAATVTIGNSRSHVNNFNCGLGGCSAPIDQVTGRMGPAAAMNETRTRVERHSHHPETGAPIDGVLVENWDTVRKTVLAVAAGLPHCPFVAWDAIPTADGPVFIDANSPPGLRVSQVHGGLLRDPRCRRFFENYDMV